MAEFEVPVVRIEEIIPIEGADKIEAVRIGGYQSIVGKGTYKVGDLAVYIPCGSIVPFEIQEEMGLVGKLSGTKKNRVKEIKLKGVLSEGLVYPVNLYSDKRRGTQFDYKPSEGHDTAEWLGITKYEPEIPTNMSGVVKPYPYTMNYDIENIKKHPSVFQTGEMVVMSEKIHGTLLQAGLIHNDDGTITKFVTSKGLGKAGIIIQDNEANENNLYVKVGKANELFEKLDALDEGEDIYIFGEVYGAGVQDLHYGGESGKPLFRAFDIYQGKKGKGRFLDVVEFVLACEAVDIPTVNYIYSGPFLIEEVNRLTNGMETMSGKATHIREGVVIRPYVEREERRLGRVVLKSVSETYLLRKGGTEYN
jgi:RNA ligase (TIGR02306 family)